MFELMSNINPAWLIVAPFVALGVLWIWQWAFKRLSARIRQKSAKQRFTMDDREKFGLAEIYIDKAGRRWYAFTNAVRMPAVRAIYSEIATRQADMNLSAEDLEALLIKQEAHMNAGKFVDAAIVNGEIRGRLTEACEEKTLLALAAYYFVLDGEDPGTIVDEWVERKQKIWREDDEAKAFFLLASYRVTGKLSDISESDILGYLARARAKRQRKSI